MPTDSAGNFHMNPQIAKAHDAPAPPMDQPADDPMQDPAVQTAIELLKAKGITADQVSAAMEPEPDADDMGGPSDNDADDSGADSEY